MKIPSFRYYFPQESIDFVSEKFREILETGAFLSTGKHCAELEDKFASYVGLQHAVTVNSGTAALEAIFRAIDVRGFDVIVPTNTFAATAFAVVHAGGRPIFADCTDDLTVDPEDVKKKLTDKTKVVVTVHVGGMVSPHTYDLVDLCEEKGIYLVEDAAHAHGSALDGKKAGTFGVAGAFSFFSTKVMTTGEGGMVVTNDEAISDKVRLLADQAKVDGRNYHEELGLNWRMAEVQALMGLAQLEHLDSFIDKRTEIAKIYDEEFENVASLSPLKVPSNVRHSYYKYIVFLDKTLNREEIQKTLKTEYNVSLGGYVYDLPCHLQPVFKDFVQSSLPVSEDLCNRHICPPIYVQMTEEEALYVVNSIKRCLQ